MTFIIRMLSISKYNPESKSNKSHNASQMFKIKEHYEKTITQINCIFMPGWILSLSDIFAF